MSRKIMIERERKLACILFWLETELHDHKWLDMYWWVVVSIFFLHKWIKFYFGANNYVRVHVTLLL
jgi:hypothetical protein